MAYLERMRRKNINGMHAEYLSLEVFKAQNSY